MSFLKYTQNKSHSFANSLHNISQQYPHLQISQITTAHLPEKYSLFSFENAHKIINLTTFCYALYSIFHLYKQYYSYPTDNIILIDSMPGKLLAYFIGHISPSLQSAILLHGNFCLQALGILLLAICYKTLAKLILYCAQGDLIDIAQDAIARAAYLIKNILLL